MNRRHSSLVVRGAGSVAIAQGPRRPTPPRQLLRGVAALLSGVLLAGCTISRNVPIRPDDAAQIRSVALVPAKNPPRLFLLSGAPAVSSAAKAVQSADGTGAPRPPLASEAAAVALLSTAIVDAFRSTSAGSALTDMLPADQARLSEAWGSTLSRALDERGLRVTMLPPTAAAGPASECSAAVGDVDAVVVAQIMAGFVSADGLRPTVAVDVKVFSRDCRQLRHAGMYWYSPARMGDLPFVPSDPRDAFPSSAELLASPDKAGEALRTGTSALATLLANTLHP